MEVKFMAKCGNEPKKEAEKWKWLPWETPSNNMFCNTLKFYTDTVLVTNYTFYEYLQRFLIKSTLKIIFVVLKKFRQ